MSRGLGIQQRIALAALARMDANYGAGRWMFVHALTRAAWPSAEPPARRRKGQRRLLRPAAELEDQVNPSRILATLADRGMIERNPRLGVGASVRLTAVGRAYAEQRLARGA
jgi:hypothetical protein